MRPSRVADENKLTLRWPEVGGRFPFYHGLFWIDRNGVVYAKRWNDYQGGTDPGSNRESHDRATGGHADEYFRGSVAPMIQPDKNYRMVIYMPSLVATSMKDVVGSDVVAEIYQYFDLIPTATDVRLMQGRVGVPEWAQR